jgi:hypothetical protein
MRNIRISEEVWQAIAKEGKFGETEDDVLRRKYGLDAILEVGSISALGKNTPTSKRTSFARRRQLAAQKMSSFIARNQIHIEFQDGGSLSLDLPKQQDKVAIRALLDKALLFAREHEASLGQLNAVRKTLTDADYHLTK